jgi:hypothetical protein
MADSIIFAKHSMKFSFWIQLCSDERVSIRLLLIISRK